MHVNIIKIITMCQANTKKGNKCTLLAKYFVDEYIQANTKDGLPLPPSSVLWLDELYAQYQMWYKATISDSRAPKRKDLEEYITKLFGPPFKKGGKRGWKSLKLRTDDNNDDDQSDEDYDMVLPQHTTTASAFI